MLCVSVILLVSLGLSSSFRIAENVVFEKTQEISVVRSKWIFSFVTDLTAYQGYLEGLRKTLERVDSDMKQVLIGYSVHGMPEHSKLYEGQRREIASLRSLYTRARNELKEILMIQRAESSPRIKRALIPLLGKVLSSLTGTLTKHDLKKVYQHIDALAGNQEQIVHVLNDTLTIFNVTRVEVRRNRHAIRSLTEMMRNMERRMIKVTMETRRHINNLNFFLITYLQTELMVTELRESVEKAMFYMDDVKMGLNQLSLGHLAPTVITPGELKRILTGIQSQIPNHLTLPAPTEDIWYYYKTLTCATLIKDQQFVTLVNLPLLELNSLFEVYQIHNIPVPYLDTKMTAKYELETTTIAVNAPRTQYILLTETDLARCSNPATNFCTLRSPVYDFAGTELCVVALFKR